MRVPVTVGAVAVSAAILGTGAANGSTAGADRLPQLKPSTAFVPAGLSREAVRSGFQVVTSADGRTIAIASPVATGAAGAILIFHRASTAWVKEATLAPPDASAGIACCGVVALSADGSTLLFGELYSRDDPISEAVWVFSRNRGAWTETGRIPSPELGCDFGADIAVSSDGGRALVTASRCRPLPEGGGSGAGLFERHGDTWTQRLSFQKGGWTGSLSADGDTALLCDFESCEIYDLSGASWAPQAAFALPDQSRVIPAENAALAPDGSIAAVDDTTRGGSDARVWLVSSTAGKKPVLLKDFDGLDLSTHATTFVDASGKVLRKVTGRWIVVSRVVPPVPAARWLGGCGLLGTIGDAAYCFGWDRGTWSAKVYVFDLASSAARPVKEPKAKSRTSRPCRSTKKSKKAHLCKP